MFQICICIFLSFTSVLTYPTINKNTDSYELSNEFLSQHFGSDFKDALHFNLQPSDIINPGNTLPKHFPESKYNGNFKRPDYVLQNPQPVKQQNRPMESLMKVQVLSPGEIEALERGVQDNTKMYKSPVVVNLPDFGSVPPKSFNQGPSSSMLRNTPVYQSNQNNMQPRFYQNNHETWPQNQQYAPYIPKTYQQLLPTPDVFEKTMQPSFQKILMKNLQPFIENNMQNIPQILQATQEKKVETMLQPSFEKPVESIPQQQPIYQQQQPPSYDQRLPEKTTKSSFDKTMQPSLDEAPITSIDKILPSIGKLLPTIIDKIQPETDKIQSSTDHIQSPNELVQPSVKTVQTSYKNVQATFEKNPVSYPTNIRHPGYEEFRSSSQPNDELKKQNPYDEVRHLTFHNSRMMSSEDETSSTSSDLSRQPVNVEKLDRTFGPYQGVSFNGSRDIKHEYSSEKKTGGR